MAAAQSKPWFRVVAVLAPLVAVAPIALGLHGGWIAFHLIGGAVTLAILVYSAYLLPAPWRWYAAVGVVISIAAITVVTSGGTLGPIIQVLMFILLAVIYLGCVFWPHSDTDA